ncbi:hypothetical protein ZIOFF_061502 [Zingiber officinale]|uniref:Retrovirus-related Pol polyprotein from transposon TNT 1-94-like beta-barrel domain-containing protein n=1 Tax=Zingiber officinale TaxID=94328 RepID=A0A8J5EZA4_ZINOF|nr:hypothetical protein ZIOFF_061502 [Zingiber officinale]
MESTGRVAGLGLELLNQSNYRIWKTCMESYLVGEDLLDVVSTNGVVAPANITENAEAFKKWKQQNAKAEFVLKRTISHGIFEHVTGCESTSEIWQTLDRLFNKRNEARLQMLENELVDAKQDDISIFEYFLKVKNLCSEISLLNPEERISEARKKRYIIRGLQPEYTPFITSIQGWAQQPSLEELENLLSSQESLAKQMATMNIKEESKRTLCDKLGHIRKDCRVKLKSENYVNLADVAKESEKEDDWKNCFLTDIVDTQRKTCLIVEGISHTKHPPKNEWIVDSGCDHHLTGDESTFSCSQLHDSGRGIITADNTIRKIHKEGTVVIDNNRGESITLKSVYHVSGIQKNLFSVANAVDAGNFVAIVQRSLIFKKNFLAFNYAKRLIEKFGLIDGKKRSTPLDVSARLRRDEGTCLSDPRPFRALVGNFIYLTITRPDIAFSVGMGVEFSLHGFVDADFSGDLDDRRSTSGFVFMGYRSGLGDVPRWLNSYCDASRSLLGREGDGAA